MSRGLNITFLIHSICAFMFGIGLYFIPEITAQMLQWTPVDPTMSRFFGTAMLAIGVKSWLGYRASTWEAVRIILIFEIVFCSLGAIIGLFSVLFVNAPIFTWVAIAIWLIFLIAFMYFYKKDSAG